MFGPLTPAIIILVAVLAYLAVGVAVITTLAYKIIGVEARLDDIQVRLGDWVALGIIVAIWPIVTVILMALTGAAVIMGKLTKKETWP